MNRSELVKHVAKHSEVTVPVTRDVLNALWDVLAMTIAVGEEVNIRGLGKLQPRTRPPVKLVNPQNGEPIWVRERRTVVFLPSNHFKARLNRE